MIAFILSVDTEGDNLWNWDKKSQISTNNSKFIPRFQELCEQYNIKPVYLINYEMAMDDNLVLYLKKKMINNKCEIGMHCHAWNTPPFYDIDKKYNGNPYITEYPEDIMYKKLKYMTDLLEEKFNTKIYSHRAGRWASNEKMFSILSSLGYKIDCSLVSNIDLSDISGLSTRKGFNYSKIVNKVYNFDDNLIEVPMTVLNLHVFSGANIVSKIKHLLCGRKYWMRTAVTDDKYLKLIINKMIQKKYEYIEFMIHSSELMPGGSPYFPNEESIERHFKSLECLFDYVSKTTKSYTLKEFYELKKEGYSK